MMRSSGKEKGTKRVVPIVPAGFIRVTAPQDLADQIRDDLKSALAKYDS